LSKRRFSKASRSEEPSTEEDSFVVMPDDIDSIDFSNDNILNDISDLFTFCKEQINSRFISVLLYMSLRRFGHSWRDIDAFLCRVGAMTAKTAHKWSNILLERDFDEFISEERGGKRGDTFWDCYPDLELEARQFVFEECSKKEASFTVESLAKFIDGRFYELNDTTKVDQRLVRSTASCRLDLRRFGAKFTANAARPYFLGHEREDVIQDREEFVKYFVQNEHQFYTITDDIIPQWKIPKVNPIILICMY
jgi:hypothetical protein